MDKIVLIVAGGSGARMQTEIPKQFLPVQGYPVVMHTLRVFHDYDPGLQLVLVLPEGQINEWKKLCATYDFTVPHEIRPGGETRFHSVKRNLADIPDGCLVAVHDGVRPLVSEETIGRCFEGALKYGNAIPCIEIPETLRLIEPKSTTQVDRSRYRLIQTPQVFTSEILKEAYRQDFQPKYTDDAGVVESMGHVIHLVEGNPENIKITYGKDLIIASCLLGSKGLQ